MLTEGFIFLLWAVYETMRLVYPHVTNIIVSGAILGLWVGREELDDEGWVRWRGRDGKRNGDPCIFTVWYTEKEFDC